MPEVTKHLLLLLIVCVAVFFTNLGAAKLWDRDEPRNAGCASEMMQRGNWVVPIFNDELRAQKPVLLYWLMISAYSVFGVNEFSARFWSAALAIGTVAGTYLIGRRLFDAKTALLASIVLATTVMFDVAGRAATPDSLLIFCGTMALMVYVLGTIQKTEQGISSQTGSWFPNRLATTSWLYFFLGLGTLAKGPIGFLLPMAIIGMFMLVMRAKQVSVESANKFKSLVSAIWRVINPLHFVQTVWAMKPLLAAAIILLVAAPWYVLVGLQTEGDFLTRFFLNENFARATTAMENHSGGPWYYPATILVGFFPWSVFALPVMLFTWRKLRGKLSPGQLPAYCFLICWVCVQVGLFSLASTKLPSYVTPCYPALAILVAAGLRSFVLSEEVVADRWYRLAAIVLAFNGLMAIVGMILVANRFLGGDVWLCSIGIAPLLGGLVGYEFMRRNAKAHAVATMALSAVLFPVSLFGLGTVAVDQHRNISRVMNPIVESNREVATFGVLESSWVFYAQRRLFELAPEKNPKNPKSLERKKDWKPKPWVSPESFVKSEAGLILTTDEHVDALLERLPEYNVLEQSPYFLKDQDLVLIGPSTKKEPRQANLKDSDSFR